MSIDTKNIHKIEKQNDKYRLRKKIIVILGAILIFWIIFDVVGIGGNIRFYTKWIECGQKPVVSGATYEGRAQHYLKAPEFSVVRLSPIQFCTPLEAELRGYSASPSQYEFPEIEKTYGSLCRREGDPQSETVREFDLCKDE